MNFRNILFFVCALFIFSGTACRTGGENQPVPKTVKTQAEFTAEFKTAFDLYSKKEYDQAFKIIKPLADAGYIPAQNALGQMYLEGLGVPKNANTAIIWLGKAADAANTMAMYNIATLYRDGKDIPKDYGKAFHYYRGAALMGMKEAQIELGKMLAQGLGAPKNQREAYKWFLNASKTDSPVKQRASELATAAANGLSMTDVLMALKDSDNFMAMTAETYLASVRPHDTRDAVTAPADTAPQPAAEAPQAEQEEDSTQADQPQADRPENQTPQPDTAADTEK